MDEGKEELGWWAEIRYNFPL